VEGQVVRRAALAALVLLAACGGASHPKVLAGARTPSFRVLYRVVHSEGGKPTIESQVVTEQRPFFASDFSYPTKPDLAAPGAPRGGTMTDVDHLYSHDGTTLRRVSGRQPGLGGGDQALLNVAHEAVARQRARVKPASVVNGKRCTVLQFAEPPVGGLSRFRDKQNHDDICIDRGGVILREQWTLNGRVVLTRQAVQLAAVPDGAFDTSAAEDVGAGLAIPRVAPMDAGLTPPPTPKGYAAATAVDFFLPRADAPSQLAYASKVWAFAKAGDEITVELGAGQVIPWSPDDDKTFALGRRNVASLVRSDGMEIHWASADHWIRVRGSVSLAALVPYARSVSNWDSSAAAVPK
jgi:hypothetical protein